MTEKLLQFIWQYKLFDASQSFTNTDGEPIQIIKSGNFNTNAGPDFLSARIKINDTLWIGNIELHLKSSDWIKHKHQHNKDYANIILHVVYENDIDLHHLFKTNFTTLELKSYLPLTIIERYHDLSYNVRFIPCENFILHIDSLTINQQLDRVLAERLAQKTQHIHNLLERYNFNWQEVFYIELARAFGLHINQTAFEQLALQTPLKLFAKHKNQLLQIEAILFGQAGFLGDYFDENYPLALQNEYTHLKKLYSLKPIEKHLWKFLRLRPANFPTLRIAQFAQLLHSANHLFSKILEATNIKEVISYFQVSTSLYWQTHYSFKEEAEPKNKTLGKTFIHLLLINVIIPSLYIYGKQQGKTEYCDKALDWLRQLPAEKNSILAKWNAYNLIASNAAESQALLQLKKEYCDQKRCLECSIGYSILKPK